MRPARAFVVGLAAMLAIGGAPQPQQPSPQAEPYRGTTDLVSIYATAMDAGGRLVTDLTKADFVVKDNGRKQPLALFNSEVQPITVVVLLDRSGSMSEHANIVAEGAAEFIRRLLPADRARIGLFGGEIRISPETFTSDQSQLLGVLTARLESNMGSPIWTAIDRSITALTKEGGRRVVLIFTDGENSPRPGQIATDLKDVIWRARYNDVMVYTIGFLREEDRPALQLPGRGRAPFGGGSRAEDRKAARAALRDLAGQSGGGYFEMNGLNDLSATFARVAEELHHQYWLGIKPPELDDTMHKLEVIVQRPKVTVQARKSYFAGSFVK